MSRFQPQIIRYESLPSTNTEVARLALLGATEGVSVLADEQTAGRGRLQRTWESPRGAGLYLSVLLRPILRLDQWPLITFAAALGVNDALRRACNLVTDIKWPNDILSGERKLCGILAETIDTNNGRGIVVGIGINLTNSAFPPEFSTRATSVEEASGTRPDRETVLMNLLDAFADWYSILQSERGNEKIIEGWTERSSYAMNRSVKVLHGEEIIEGITCGLDNDGGLRLRTDSGQLRVVHAGDVSLRSS